MTARRSGTEALRRAIDLLREGRAEEARGLLEPLVRDRPLDALARRRVRAALGRPIGLDDLPDFPINAPLRAVLREGAADSPRSPRPRPGVVERREDMSARGRLRLLVQDDGDVIVEVAEEVSGGLTGPYSGVEFCQPGTGGGHSPRTHAALLALAVAMACDGEEDPDNPADPESGSALRARDGGAS